MERLCPVCWESMREKKVENSLSHFARGVFICNHCGQLESIRGNFWNPSPRDAVKIQKSQEGWEPDFEFDREPL
jgi:hypothetical protein